MIGDTVEATSDERVMAALAHFFGTIAAVLVWATQRDKSRFVRFQALQAMAFDAVFMIFYILFMFCAMSGASIFILAGAWNAAQSTTADNLFPAMMLGMVAPSLMFICIMPLVLGISLVRLVAAVSVATGHNFRYPFIAAKVEAFLRGSPAPDVPIAPVS